MDHVTDCDASELRPESRVGRYEIVKLLAKGGMAEIYLAKCVGMHGFETLSVLKRLPPSCLVNNPRYATLFFDEARLVASLRHPNIAQVFDFGQDEDSYYFIMEYLDGLNVRQLIKQFRRRGARVPLASAIQIVLGVAAGLHAAHEAKGPDGQALNIVHRDVSPTNILVTTDGAVKVIDFGVAKSTTGRARTEVGVVKGKYAYMSPEQCCAQPIDRRTDLYALGVVLYELTTGIRPHGKGCGPELLQHVVEEDCPDPRLTIADFPDELAEILNKLLHRDKEQRYQSAREVHEDLSQFAARHQIMLSPYELASWIQELSQESADQRPATRSLRAATRADTHAFARDAIGEALIDFDVSHSGLAVGTGPLEELPVARMHAFSRAISLPYAELAIGTSDDNRIFDEETARGARIEAESLEAESLESKSLESESLESKSLESESLESKSLAAPATRKRERRSWQRSVAAVLSGTAVALLCAGAGVSIAAMTGYLGGVDMNGLVDFVTQLPG